MNMDSVSLLYNFEANIVTSNDRFSKELKAHFFQDLEESKQVHLRDWQKRFIGEKIMSFFIHLIKRFLWFGLQINHLLIEAIYAINMALIVTFETLAIRVKINHQIKAPELRVITAEGDNLGVITFAEAIKKAQEAGLDLIEISPTAVPPVAKIMD